MKYTIEDLREGKVAVVNDGTVEELYNVLKRAFPEDPYSPDGYNTYYYCSSYNKNRWTSCSAKIELPVQSVKDFLWKPNRGDKVLVSDGEPFWREGIYLATIEGAKLPIICVSHAEEQQFLDGKPFSKLSYMFMKPIEDKIIEVTLDEIAKKFGVDTKQLRIKKDV